MINKLTHVINELSSCIELIFSSNTSFVKKNMEGNCRSMKNVIITSSMEPEISIYPFLLLIIETFGITNMQIQKASKRQFQRLTNLRLFSILMQIENAKYELTFN